MAIFSAPELKAAFVLKWAMPWKEDYPRVLHLVSSRVRRGGLFITDNVLWSGRVVQQAADEESTRAIQEFNRRLYAMQEFFTTVVPLRDGLAVALKL